MRDVTKVLIVQLKMAYIHSDIDTCDHGQCVNLVIRIRSCMTVFVVANLENIVIIALMELHV